MNSKTRVRLAFTHQEPDRVPMNYVANAGIDARLKEHFGLALEDHDGLLEKLEVDFRTVNPPYTGPAIHKPVADREIDIWGIHRRWVEHGTGGYWDYCDFPLREAGLAEMRAWPFPSPDDFDYAHVASECDRYAQFAVVTGSAGLGDYINSTGMVRGMEQVLLDLLTNDPAGLYYMDRKTEVTLEVTRRTLERCKGKIDILNIGEDLGTQIGQMISMKVFRQQIRPRLQQYVDLALAHGIVVMFHSCGSSSWVFEDLLEMGITIIDTLQPEAKNMQPEYLKAHFGDRLSFHGAITTGGAIAFGTLEEARETVRRTLEIMMPGGGYALAPSHALQDNSPTENVLAIYEIGKQYGVYA